MYLLPTTARSTIIVADDSFYTRLLKSRQLRGSHCVGCVDDFRHGSSCPEKIWPLILFTYPPQYTEATSRPFEKTRVAAARAPRAATRPQRRRAWLRIFVVRCGLPCDPPVGGHSCNGGMIPRFHHTVCESGR